MNIYTIRLLRLILASFFGFFVLFSTSCSDLMNRGRSDDVQVIGAAILGCIIGGKSFNAVGVSCLNGVASGTGTLTAISDQNAPHSIELTFQLSSNGSLGVVGCANIAANSGVITWGHGFNITNTYAHGKGPSVEGLASIGSAGTSQNTWCLEMHPPATDVHLMADPFACVPKDADSVTYNSESDGSGLNNGSKQGDNWGFVLSNATITGLAIKDGPIFSH